MSPPSFPLHCFSGKLSVFVDTPPPNRIENAISQRTAATRYLRMCTFDTGMPLMISRDAHRSNVTVRKHHKRRVSILFSGKSADLWILTGTRPPGRPRERIVELLLHTQGSIADILFALSWWGPSFPPGAGGSGHCYCALRTTCTHLCHILI